MSNVYVYIIITVIVGLMLYKIFNKNSSNTNNGVRQNKQDRQILVEQSSFCLIIDDIFNIKGVGQILAGKVNKGELHTGDTVYVLTKKGNIHEHRVKKIEIMGKKLLKAESGMAVGIVLQKKDTAISGGDLIYKK